MLVYGEPSKNISRLLVRAAYVAIQTQGLYKMACLPVVGFHVMHFENDQPSEWRERPAVCQAHVD